MNPLKYKFWIIDIHKAEAKFAPTDFPHDIHLLSIVYNDDNRTTIIKIDPL
jgi:hypothetical protein